MSQCGYRYSATSPTADTGIAAALTQTFSATAAFLTLFNNLAKESSKIVPRTLKLITTVAPASATSFKGSIVTDNTNRFSSGGSTLTGNALHGDTTRTSLAVINAGAVVAAAASAARVLARFQARAAIPVVGDEYLFVFGSKGQGASIPINGTNASRIVIPLPKVEIANGHTMLLHAWWASVAVTPASFETELVYDEIP